MGKKVEENLAERPVEENLAERPDEHVITTSKDASIDWPVLVESLTGDKFHQDGEEFHVGHKKAVELHKAGKVKVKGEPEGAPNDVKSWFKKALGVIALLLCAFVSSFAQLSVDLPMYNPGNTFVLANLSTATATRDTVTNTGVAYLNSKKVNGAGTVTIAIVVTKVSGTVGGTISLQGSLNGTDYKALNTQETQTALATITAADASGSYHWRLSNSPFTYYRVSWTGTGTMVAYLDARILKH